MAVSARIRKRQYEAAVARENYLKTRDLPEKNVAKLPKTLVYYGSSLFKSGTNSDLIELQASERSLKWFGGGGDTDAGITALGLKKTLSTTESASNKPRFWTPAMVHAGVGLASPKRTTTPWKTRSTKTISASYSAPISSLSNLVTYDAVVTRATSLKNARSTALGDDSYSQFYVTPEIYNNQI